MKKFTENIVERIIGSDKAEVTKGKTWTNLYWEKSMSQIGSGYIYCLSWISQDGKIQWIERDGDYNLKENTGMTCICDQFRNFEDELFVTLSDLEKEKDDILALAEKIYAEQNKPAGN